MRTRRSRPLIRLTIGPRPALPIQPDETQGFGTGLAGVDAGAHGVEAEIALALGFVGEDDEKSGAAVGETFALLVQVVDADGVG